jgi:chromate transporter
VATLLGRGHVFTEQALFFSKAAIVTFGGAYAVLAYVAQQAVEVYGWLRPDEMLTGLGLAETTPGPLILVLVFVGFLAGFRGETGLEPVLAGALGAVITLWVTFVPSFLFILPGRLSWSAYAATRRSPGRSPRSRRLSWASSPTWRFGSACMCFLRKWRRSHSAPAALPAPHLGSIDLPAAVIAAVAAVALLRFHVNVVLVLFGAAAAGAATQILL